jgi:predicted trehalose synthase
MNQTQAKHLPEALKNLLAEKSRLLSQAQAFEAMGMTETAASLWLSAASHEERLAPLMERVGRTAEAALHRVSAASCYAKAGRLGQAINLCRAALAGPLPNHTRQEVEALAQQYLAELDQDMALVI